MLFSPSGDLHNFHLPGLFLCEFSEEIYLFFARWFPSIIGLEGTLQVSFYIYIESLWFELWVRWVIYSWNGLGRGQMMKISSKFMELSSGRLLLQFSFFKSSFPCEIIQLFPDFFIFVLNVHKIALSGIEVMLILSAIETSIVLLYYLALLIEELALFILVFFLFLIHKFAPTVIATKDSLNGQWCTDFVLELPLDFEHAPELLDYDGSRVFFVSELFSFVKHVVIGVYNISMPCISFGEVLGHFNLNN